MSENTFAHSTTRGPLTRVATGIGVTLAAIATIGLGAGAATAAPQQPFAADDPIPGMPGAGSAVNIANSLFGSLSGLMNNVFPGAGDLLMPAGSLMQGGGGGGLPVFPAGFRAVQVVACPACPVVFRAVRPGWAADFRAKPRGWAATPADCRDKPRGWAATPADCRDKPLATRGGLPGQTPGGLPGQQLPGQTPGLGG